MTLPETPYKGLMPYDESDAPFFFGRERDRDVITANLLASRLTLLYGASGVGKSSVLRAGVAHALREQSTVGRGEERSPEFVLVLFASWRDDPVAALLARVEDSVRQALGNPTLSIPAAPSRSLADALDAWSECASADILIILDQFEEYFLYHAQEAEEVSFAVQFPRAVNRGSLRANFLVSFREDSLARLDRFKGRIPGLYDNYLRIKHLDLEAARAAIEKPIEQYNTMLAGEGEPVRLEPELVAAVLDKVQVGQTILGESGRGVVAGGRAEVQIETPYLQLVMTRIWDEEMIQGSRVLRLQTLERLGGTEQIIRAHLDAAMNALTEPQQAIAADVFHMLVTPSGTKIAHTVRDLGNYVRVPDADLFPVLEQLASGSNRILRPVAPPPDQPDSPRYEIFHDVLASAILDWRARYEKEQERRSAEKKLAQEREEALKQFVAEREQLTARRKAEEEKQRADAAQKLAETERRARVRQRYLSMGLAVLLVAALAATLFAFQQSGVAQTEKAAALDAKATAVAEQNVSRSREIAATAANQLNVDPELATLLALEAIQAADTQEAESVLRQSLAATSGDVVLRAAGGGLTAAGFSADGRRIVTGSKDGIVQVWETSGRALGSPFKGAGPISDVSFTWDGQRIMLLAGGKPPILIDATTGKLLSTAPGPANVISASASPDERLFVEAMGDSTSAVVWDLVFGKQSAPLTGHTMQINSVAFSPDSKMIATASDDGTARLWTMAGSLLKVLSVGTGRVTSAAFSPDGRLVVTTGQDKTARVWDVSSGKQLSVLTGHTDLVESAAFSPDAKSLVTASDDNTARVWDVASGRELAVLRGHTGDVTQASFSPRDGLMVLTASADGTARVWDLSSTLKMTELRDERNGITAAAYSPDGSLIAATGKNAEGKRANIQLWDVAKETVTANLPAQSDAVVTAIAFSPDGSKLASLDGTGNIVLWDVEQKAPIGSWRGPERIGWTIAFSPDGKTIITGGGPGIIHAYDVESRKEIGVMKWDMGVVRSLAFSPDGERLATSSEDGTVRIWKIRDEKEEQRLTGHKGLVNSVAFSPDGKWIVTGSDDQTARVWDVASGQEMVTLRGHTNRIWTAAFDPTSSLVVTGSMDGTARVWDLSGVSFMVLSGHSAPVTAVGFGPKEGVGGSVPILTGSEDMTLQIYQCSVCGSLDALKARAELRVRRELTCEERRSLLHEEAICETPTPASGSVSPSAAAAPTVAPAAGPSKTPTAAPSWTPTLMSVSACPLTISGSVFVDSNGSGTRDKGDSGLALVQVSLKDAMSKAELASVLTDSSGSYRFSNLPPAGLYLVVVGWPTNYVATTKTELANTPRANPCSMLMPDVGFAPLAQQQVPPNPTVLPYSK